MYIKYNSTCDLYEVINKILNKITLDLLGNNNNYRDFILIEDYDEINEIDIWNKNINENSYHSIWLPFTPENVKFLTIEDCDDITDPNFITIRGEINENLIFTYDAPIVSTNVDWSYYKKTRAH